MTSPQRSSFHLVTLGFTQEEIGRSSFSVPVFNQEALSHARNVTANSSEGVVLLVCFILLCFCLREPITMEWHTQGPLVLKVLGLFSLLWLRSQVNIHTLKTLHPAAPEPIISPESYNPKIKVL